MNQSREGQRATLLGYPVFTNKHIKDEDTIILLKHIMVRDDKNRLVETSMKVAHIQMDEFLSETIDKLTKAKDSGDSWMMSPKSLLRLEKYFKKMNPYETRR